MFRIFCARSWAWHFALTAAFGLTLGSAITPAYGAESDLSLHRALDAGDSWTLSGSARIRYETLAEQVRAGLSANDDLVNFRTHLFAEYKTDAFRFGADLYDSRLYQGTLDGGASTVEGDAFEASQLYIGADLGSGLGQQTKTTLQAGRLQVNLGSRRLVRSTNLRDTWVWGL